MPECSISCLLLSRCWDPKLVMKETDRSDFRLTRRRLPPEAFAVGPRGPDPPPRDLVEGETWGSIVVLPDDVSLRTSDNHGPELKAMDELWGSLIESTGVEKDAVWYTMLDAADELQACTFNSLCGYYRVASSCLRSAVELMTIGTMFQLYPSASEFRRWTKGKFEVGFGMACDHLIGHPRVQVLEDYLRLKMHYSIFGQKSSMNREGWARKLYSELSNFAHSRPSHSSAMMWKGSNGSIYVPSSFGKVFALYLDTAALTYVLLKLARPAFKRPLAAKYIFHSPNALPSKVAVYAHGFLWSDAKF